MLPPGAANLLCLCDDDSPRQDRGEIMTMTSLRLCDTSDMVVVHRVFRREFRLLPRMVRAVPRGDICRAAEITAHAEDIADALHDHHHNEDRLLWPKLIDRARLDLEIVVKMERQHQGLGQLLDRMEALLPRWRETADADLGEQLAATLLDVSAALDEHLADEETHTLPIVERHITQHEWTELGESAIANMSKARLLVFFGYILEEATPAERSAMLAKLPPPARVAYRLIGERRSRRITASLRRDLA
jgi:hemerythrin-like domain-containing protein